MLRYLFVGLSVCALAASAVAEAPGIEWQKVFGDENPNRANSVVEITGVGYVVAGYCYNDKYRDFYVVRTDLDGDSLWGRGYGGEHDDVANCVMLADSGGFMVCGFESSYPPDGYDVRVMNLSPMGGEFWAESYGIEYESEYGSSMCRLLDGNYMVAGYGRGGWYFIKINSRGDILSETFFQHTNNFYEIIPTSDGGAMAVGGGTGLALAKLGSHGDTVWTKYYGGSRGSSVVQLDDGGYAALGFKTFSPMGDDFWLVRLDADGNILWDKHYGNQYDDEGYSLARTPDGGFVMAGRMFPPSGNEWPQVWVVRTDSDGDTLWTKSFGGDGSEIALSIKPTFDNGYIIAGETNSIGAGSTDMYLVKLEPDPTLPTAVDDLDASALPGFRLHQNYPNPFNPSTVIEFDLARRSVVTVSVFNLLGQKVATLADDEFAAGGYAIPWDGTTDRGQPVATGVYVYRINAGEFVASKKMILLR